jgi:membrane protein implicated in regulation of membrane protease activity
MFDEWTIWHWFSTGGVLMILEVFVPGAVFLWLGLSAIATGLIKIALPGMGWEIEILIFSVLSVVSVLVGRRFVKYQLMETDHPTLNRRMEEFVGSVFVLAADTVNGHGRVKVGDSLWSVTLPPDSDDLKEGTKVRVTGSKGTTMTVEPVIPAPAP